MKIEQIIKEIEEFEVEMLPNSFFDEEGLKNLLIKDDINLEVNIGDKEIIYKGVLVAKLISAHYSYPVETWRVL